MFSFICKSGAQDISPPKAKYLFPLGQAIVAPRLQYRECLCFHGRERRMQTIRLFDLTKRITGTKRVVIFTPERRAHRSSRERGPGSALG
jgi:hypothetical protein